MVEAYGMVDMIISLIKIDLKILNGPFLDILLNNPNSFIMNP